MDLLVILIVRGINYLIYKMDDINICYTIDKNNVELTLNSIFYIKKFFKNKKYNLSFYIVSNDDLTLPDFINFKKIDTKYSIVQQRFLLPEIINLDKIIFLDSDTIAMTCISKLWDINLENKIAGGCILKPIPNFNRLVNKWNFNFKPFNKLGNKPYFNTGVLLIDFNLLNKKNITNKCKDFLLSYKHTQHKHRGEPCINAALVDNIKTIDERWNHCPESKFKKVFISHYYNINLKSKPDHKLY